jgi:hypothetical protein
MKFRIKVLGKDSINEGVVKPSLAVLKEKGVKYGGPDDAEWDEAIEAEQKRLEKFVKQFLIDGSGGDDAVTVEFDTEAGTCVVVPRAKKVKPY